MPEFPPEVRFRRMLIGDTRDLCGHIVTRVNDNEWAVDGRSILKGSEGMDRFEARVLYAITGDPVWAERAKSKRTEKKRQQMQAHQAKRMHPCALCGKLVFERSVHCQKCAGIVRRALNQACRICGAPFRAYVPHVGGKNMLSREGVCAGCKPEYVRRITAGEMEP